MKKNKFREFTRHAAFAQMKQPNWNPVILEFILKKPSNFQNQCHCKNSTPNQILTQSQSYKTIFNNLLGIEELFILLMIKKYRSVSRFEKSCRWQQPNLLFSGLWSKIFLLRSPLMLTSFLCKAQIIIYFRIISKNEVKHLLRFQESNLFYIICSLINKNPWLAINMFSTNVQALKKQLLK